MLNFLQGLDRKIYCNLTGAGISRELASRSLLSSKTYHQQRANHTFRNTSSFRAGRRLAQQLQFYFRARGNQRRTDKGSKRPRGGNPGTAKFYRQEGKFVQ